MGKSLRLYGLTEKELRLARTLDEGIREWEELSERNKLILLNCNYSLEGLVPKDEILRYELKIQAEEGEKFRERLQARARLGLDRAGIVNINNDDNNQIET